MNQLLNKLERKFGRFAVHDFMKYVVVIYLVGAVISMINPQIYYQYLCLDIGKVLKGQVWRLVTYLLAPYGMTSITDILFLGIELYLYYYIGRSLENAWGAFRFNLYFISGVIFNIIAAFILYFVFDGMIYPMGLTYISRSLFLAFAVVFPNMQLLLFYIIPIKMKWLGYIYGAMLLFEVISYMSSFTPTGIAMGISIVIAVANFLVYFFATRNYRRISPKEVQRRRKFRQQTASVVNITRHRCEVCGKTERDDPNLEFRFCSKCDGDHEYCMEHLFTHEHVRNHQE